MDEDVIALHTGQILTTHGSSQCAGEVCCIHNPSDHHMVTWPQHWRGDRRIMERLCQHGIGHPDPDDFNIRTYRDSGIHGCDGCCRPRSTNAVEDDAHNPS